MILSISLFLILSNPTAYELYVERKGEAMKSKRWSMFVRVVISLGSVWVAAVFKNELLWLDVLKSAALAFGIFFGFFDYLYNIIFHKRTRVWYEYLSKSPIDKVMGKVNWRWRMAVRAAVFVGAMVWFYW